MIDQNLSREPEATQIIKLLQYLAIRDQTNKNETRERNRI